jgi:hypothetical protein
MASYTGSRGTATILADQREIDMSDRITELEPDAAPLTVFSKRLNKRRTVNPKFEWLENDLEPRFDRINNGAGYASGATSIVVDNGGYFNAQDIVYVSRTGEAVRVTAVATNTLTVVRGVGSTAAALVDNDELIIIGSAAREGDTSKTPVSHNPTKVTGYTQIFRTPFELTETLRHSANAVKPHDWTLSANHAGVEHMKDIEYAFLFGHPSETIPGGEHPRRTTGGFYHYATLNETLAGGSLTETEFFAGLRDVFRYGSKVKLGIASRLAVDVLNSFPRGKLETVQSEKTYGVRVMRYISPHGDLNIVTHNLLEGDEFGGHIAIVDLDNVAYRYLAGENGSRDTRLLTNRQAPDADTRKDEYLSEVGLQLAVPKTHGSITGITS